MRTVPSTVKATEKVIMSSTEYRVPTCLGHEDPIAELEELLQRSITIVNSLGTNGANGDCRRCQLLYQNVDAVCFETLRKKLVEVGDAFAVVADHTLLHTQLICQACHRYFPHVETHLRTIREMTSYEDCTCIRCPECENEPVDWVTYDAWSCLCGSQYSCRGGERCRGCQNCDICGKKFYGSLMYSE